MFKSNLIHLLFNVVNFHTFLCLNSTATDTHKLIHMSRVLNRNGQQITYSRAFFFKPVGKYTWVKQAKVRTNERQFVFTYPIETIIWRTQDKMDKPKVWIKEGQIIEVLPHIRSMTDMTDTCISNFV